MTRTMALIVVGLLIVWLLKLTRDQKQIWLLLIRAVPGTVNSFPYDHSDGRVSQEKRVQGGGFVIGLTTPDLPDTPLPPRIRLEFRDDTLSIRTWMAKVDNAEWSDGDRR